MKKHSIDSAYALTLARRAVRARANYLTALTGLREISVLNEKTLQILVDRVSSAVDRGADARLVHAKELITEIKAHEADALFTPTREETR